MVNNYTLIQSKEIMDQFMQHDSNFTFGLTTVQLCINTPASRLARGLAVQSNGVQPFYQADNISIDPTVVTPLTIDEIKALLSSADASPPKPQHKDN